MEKIEEKPAEIIMSLDDAFTNEPEGAGYLRIQKFVKVDGFGDEQGITEFFQIVEGENKGEYFGRYHNRGDLRGHIFKTTKEQIEKDIKDNS